MSEHFWGRAVREVALAAAAATVFCLLFEALLAVFVRAYALSSEAILLSNLLCKTAAAFAFSLLFVRRERALVKGVMVESYLVEGAQKISDHMVRGQSITDPCLGWEDTEKLLCMIADRV